MCKSLFFGHYLENREVDGINGEETSKGGKPETW